MTVVFADAFTGSGNVTDAIPQGWTATNGTDWSIKAAPSWANGLIAQGVHNSVTDNLLFQSFSGNAGSGYKIRVRWGTDGTPSTNRNGMINLYSGSSVGIGMLLRQNPDYVSYQTVSPSVQTLLGSYSANTLYDTTILLGSSGVVTSITVNGSVVTGIGTLGNSLTTLNKVEFDTFNAGLTESGHTQVDAVIVDNTSAVPNGTISASGTLDAFTLGPDSYGGVMIGYTNGASAASTIYKLERSSDSGTTWASVGFGCYASASGFLIWDPRPQYGGQPVVVGNTATYRVTAMNASGDQVL